MTKIIKEGFRRSKNVCGGGETRESFQERGENNTLYNIFKKYYSNILENSDKGGGFLTPSHQMNYYSAGKSVWGNLLQH